MPDYISPELNPNRPGGPACDRPDQPGDHGGDEHRKEKKTAIRQLKVSTPTTNSSPVASSLA